MPIYMTPPTPDEFDPNQIGSPQPPSPNADYFHKVDHGASVDYFVKGEHGANADYFVKAEGAQVDYFVKAEGAQVDYFHKESPSPEGFSWGERQPSMGNAGPGGGPHTRQSIIGPERRSGISLVGILIGLLLFSLAGILIGLLLFAPPDMAGSTAALMAGSDWPSDPCAVPDSEDLSGVIAILVGMDSMRTSIGGTSFFQGGCSQPTVDQAEPPAAPTNGPATQPTKTPVPANTTNNTSGGGQQPNPNTSGGGDQPTDPCLPNNGGIASYEPSYCNCNGTTSTIIFCQDGTRIETVNVGGACQPDPALCQQQPSTDGGGQQTPTCEYKCYVSDPNKPEQCLQGGWVYPGTDTYCDPQNP